MIRVSEIKMNLEEDKKLLKKKIAKKLHIEEKEVLDYFIYKQSLDARKKGNLFFVYTVDVLVKNEKMIFLKTKDNKITKTPDMEYHFPKEKAVFEKRPVVVGFGPAGMFCALILAQMGACPIVLERGEEVDERTKTVKQFWETGILNTESNVQFGEGGAGTFSDGKLTTRIKDMRCRKVLEELVEAGAPEEILYVQKPHIGTDKLKTVVKNIRKKIISLGGEIHFKSKVTDFEIKSGKLSAVIVNREKRIETQTAFFCIGHSARDTFELFYKKGIQMEQKPFAMGVRIEHPQKMINEVQYGQADMEKLGAADYRLTYTTKKGRSVYTFCMCPGGFVVAAASEKDSIAVNGMSEYARDGKNANSALLVQVFPEDFKSSHVLAGMHLQRELEKKTFLAGGSNYNAPVQLVGDFLEGNQSVQLEEVKNTYQPNICFCDLKTILPDFISEALKEAIPEMGKKLKGFDRKDALLTAVETRSSSPVRILRTPVGQSVTVKGIYPVGEGAGYAGGIVSAAVDGILAAENAVQCDKIENN